MNDSLADLLTVAVLGFIGVRLVTGARHARSANGRALTRRIVANLGWRHLWPVPLVLAVVVTAAYLLLGVPGLDWGWWTALGGDGNPVFGSSTGTSGLLWDTIVPLLFVALLIPALPLFAHAEERMFRTGAELWSWPRRLYRVVLFGLAHALIGVPIGAALALSLGGAYFMACYLHAWRRGADRVAATIESATAHTAYNAVVVAVVLAALVVDVVR